MDCQALGPSLGLEAWRVGPVQLIESCRVGPVQLAEIGKARGQASYLDTLPLPGRTRATIRDCRVGPVQEGLPGRTRARRARGQASYLDTLKTAGSDPCNHSKLFEKVPRCGVRLPTLTHCAQLLSSPHGTAGSDPCNHSSARQSRVISRVRISLRS
jgi:hypothetical protein